MIGYAVRCHEDVLHDSLLPLSQEPVLIRIHAVIHRIRSTNLAVQPVRVYRVFPVNLNIPTIGLITRVATPNSRSQPTR